MYPILINFEINFNLSRFSNCVISDFAARSSTSGGNTVDPATGTSFAITKKHNYVPEITLFAEDNAKQLLQLAIVIVITNCPLPPPAPPPAKKNKTLSINF